MKTTTRIRAKQALAKGLEAARPEVRTDARGYVGRIEDNLVAGVTLDQFVDDLDGAAGHEMGGPARSEGAVPPPKILAAHSSAMLAVNSLGPWRAEPRDLALAGSTGFATLRFERPCPTGLAGTPPTLDVLADGPGAIVGVESKCIEYLEPTTPVFSPSYASLPDAAKASPWFRLIEEVESGRERFAYLDVAQLVKHALGLAMTYDSPRPNARVSLLYLFWEPSNAREVAECVAHRQEVARLLNLVAHARVTFSAMTYASLWERWEAATRPAWVRRHAANVMGRYRVAI